MTRFTADDAFAASEDNDPIMLSGQDVVAMCRDHGSDPDDFWVDEFHGAVPPSVDAAKLLGWLGY